MHISAKIYCTPLGISFHKENSSFFVMVVLKFVMSTSVLFTYYFNYYWTCYLYGPIRNDFDAGKSITRAIGRALNIETFWGPEMASS